MPKYKTTGTLTGTIAPENVPAAQLYLNCVVEGGMTQFIDDGLKDVVLHVQWDLKHDGHNYEVLVVSKQPLTDEQSKQMSSWISGQNSDGLGEGFEQQDFAEEPCSGCDDCEANPYDACDGGSMISFDWETNDSALVLQ